MEESALVIDMLRSTGKLFFVMKPSHRPMIPMLHGEMFILDHLERQNDTVTPSEFSAIMRGSSSRTAIALRNLEQKGYIERDMDKTDRRKIKVSITEEGRKLACSERETLMLKIRMIVDELGEEDTREFIRIAGRIVEITNKL